MRRERRKLNLTTDINVASLVDVSLTLLIIFILVAPMIKHGIEINLPRVSASGIELEGQAVITVDRDERIFLNEKRILFEDIAAGIMSRAPNIIYIQADESVPHGAIIGIMGEIRKAGILNIGIVTEPK
jgi:biopolymer transport protein TolR